MTDLYLGRTVSDGQPLLYPSRDLVTHGVCVGMTGSGKTGLCLGLLEELLLADVPLFLLDPKGDVTNLLLMFPTLEAAEFAPWIDPETARRNGRSVEQEAAAQAALWKEGLAKWNVPPESLQQLRDRVSYRVFSPGSRSAQPVNLLGAFAPPPGLTWERDEEVLRDEIRAQVSGVLALAGVDSETLQDPRHILLARVVETSWKEGRPLDLSSLIAFTENPTFSRVGAMDLEAFLPRAKRRELALSLNTLLASPDFETWMTGDPLDPDRLARASDGRAACNLFYLAHLDDRERMFFVSRFLERYWGWARVQTGAADLRALLYFDEVMGFLPPVAEPPSKRPLLSLLKQGRAFGCGVLLVTQNPVDLDYKALSNAGTWFVGRLQAQRDKDRLLDGLESAGIGMERGELDRTISGLEKRRFLLHDVHRPGGPVVFESRWARAFLRGPLAPRELPRLATAAEIAVPAGASPPGRAGSAPEVASAAVGSPVPPALDPAFLHRYASASQGLLSGSVAALVEATVSRQRPPLAATRHYLVRLGSGPIAEAKIEGAESMESWSELPPPQHAYGPLPLWATKSGAALPLERLVKEAVSSHGLRLESIPALGLVRSPDESPDAFQKRVAQAVEAEVTRRAAKVRGPLDRRIATLERQIAAENRELVREKAEQTRAATYSAVDVGASVLGTILGGGRRGAGAAARAGGRGYARIQRAAENVKESEAKIAAWTQERDTLIAQRDTDLAAARQQVEAQTTPRGEERFPVSRGGVRVLGWYILWT